DAQCSEQDAQCSEQDAQCSEQDAQCSEQDAQCSEQDAQCSEQDARTTRVGAIIGIKVEMPNSLLAMCQANYALCPLFVITSLPFYSLLSTCCYTSE
ncbi:MAG: hypothetical protein RIB93_22120, partial [Coleofasciculus sp. D1-CHI-01]|uniref:hypothetical protein n=1 Tax=Coleofasciculus sp. D1-CHI-01 TaxID=3068482 RepID=UPI0032FA162E